MKFLRNAFLLLLIAVLAFSGAGMAWGADLILTNPTTPGNAGSLETSASVVPVYKANVYYLDTGTSAVPEVKVPVCIEVTATPFDGNETLTLTPSTPVTVPAPSALTSTGTGALALVPDVELVVPATTTASLTGGTTLTTTLTLTQNSDSANSAKSATATLELTYIPVSVSLISKPSEMVFERGKAASYTVTAQAVYSANGVSPQYAEFDCLQLYRSIGADIADPINTGDPVWIDPGSNVTVTDTTVPSNAPTVTLEATVSALPSVIEPATIFAVKTNQLTVDEPFAGGLSDIPVAKAKPTTPPLDPGILVDTIVARIIEKTQYSITLDPAVISHAGSFDDVVKVVVNDASAPAITRLVLLDGSNEVLSLVQKGLTYTVDLATLTVTVKGDPTEYGVHPSVTVRVHFTTAGTGGSTGSDIYADAELTVEVIHPRYYTMVLNPSSLTAVKNTAMVPLKVIPSMQGTPAAYLTALVFDNGGGTSLTRNGITATIGSDLTITFFGTPRDTGTTVFSLLGVSPTAGGVFLAYLPVHVTDIRGGEVIDTSRDAIDIYNQSSGTTSGYKEYSDGTTSFRVNVPQQLYFHAKTGLSGLTVTMNERTLVEEVDYRVDTLPGSEVEIVVSVTPDMTGYYTFVFGYTYNGVKYSQSATLKATAEDRDVHHDSGSGSSGCSSGGTGIAALVLCLGGLLRRKGR